MSSNKTALLFPGQGAQTIGMGRDLYDNFAQARAVYQEIDDALSQDLSKIIFNGPQEDLNMTANTQPAIMATSLAAVKVFEHLSGKALSDIGFLAAGHSLGEYSAHAAMGSFSLSDTARLLRARGNAMQDAVPVGKGGIVALVACDAETADKICAQASEHGLAQVANDNGAGQIVISGALEAMQYVVDNYKEFGIKRAVMLPVSAPFHSEWMKPAADTMKDELSKVEINKPALPILCNVLVETVDSASAIRDTLVAQVAGKVRWRESIDYMLANGVDTFVELGPGKVLTTLVKRINRDAKTYNLLSVDSFEDFIKNEL